MLAGDVISVVGGKLTTYRRMAEDAVDLVTDRECRTRTLPLVGAVGPRVEGVPERLCRRFGAEAGHVAGLAGGDSRLLAPIGDSPILGVELLWAASAEGAVTDDDVVSRRVRADMVPAWQESVTAALPTLHAPM